MSDIEFPTTMAMITGTEGPDSLDGTIGDDIINALGGDDFINGSDGTDVIDGGDGNDLFSIFTVGNLLPQYSGVAADRDLTVTATGVIDSAGNINTSFVNIETVTVGFFEFQPGVGTVDPYDNVYDGSAFTGSGGVNFLSRGGMDTLIGSAQTDRFSTRVGTPFDSDVTVTGGAGDDLGVIGLQNDQTPLSLVASVSGNTVTFTSDLGDILRFTDVAEFSMFIAAFGSTGMTAPTSIDASLVTQDIEFEFTGGNNFPDHIRDNTILSGTGNDTINTTAGDDIIWGNFGDDILNGGNGIDTLDFTNSTVGVTVDLNVNTAQDTGEGMDTISNFERIIGSDFDDVLTGFNSGFSSLLGRGGNDIINGSTAGEEINGGDGDDELFGNSGNNLIHGEAGDDILYSGDEDDLLDGGSGSDQASYAQSGTPVSVNLNIQGSAQNTGDGQDTLVSIEGLIGSAFDDTLRGDLGANVIDGGDGNDTVFGGRGFDTLNGGAGNDNLQGQVGNDVINGDGGADFLYGGDGFDTISGGDDNDTIRGQNQGDTLDGNGGNDLIFGGEGQDTINGGDGNDGLYGEQRVDWLNGDAGNDYLSGGAATDFLDGGAGLDRIDGGAGRDIMTGGDDADRFFFDDGDFLGLAITTADRITDFSQSQGDFIDLSAVDAIAGGGDDGFTFVGTDAFSGTAGELRYQFVSGATLIRGDTDGDGNADFAIRLDGQVQLVDTDFVL